MKFNLNDLCPCKKRKRPSEDRYPESDSGGRDCWPCCSSKPRNTWHDQKLQEARKDPPLEPSEGVWPHQYPDFGLLASTTERENFCCGKPASSWYFDRAVLGN